jgi:hypothetical protein
MSSPESATLPDAAQPAVCVFVATTSPTVGRPECGSSLGRLCAAEQRSRAGAVQRDSAGPTGSRLMGAARSGPRAEAAYRCPAIRAAQGTLAAGEGKHSEPQRRTALGPSAKLELPLTPGKPGAPASPAFVNVAPEPQPETPKC